MTEPYITPTPRNRPARSMTDKDLSDLAIEIARLISERHCTDVVLIDAREVTNVTDYLVIGTGRSDRQIRALGDEIAHFARDHGLVRLGTEVDQRATWVVVDLADIVVHLFDPDARAHYDLEMLWGDAPRLTWERPGKIATPDEPAAG